MFRPPLSFPQHVHVEPSGVGGSCCGDRLLKEMARREIEIRIVRLYTTPYTASAKSGRQRRALTPPAQIISALEETEIAAIDPRGLVPLADYRKGAIRRSRT
jgi:hypothetical protein